MSAVSSDEIKGYIYGYITNTPEPWQLENRRKAKIKLLKDIEDCNRELDKLPKPLKCYDLGTMDALFYAWHRWKNYLAP